MMTDMVSGSIAVRWEEPADLEAVRAVNRAAFGGDVEADLVQRLWADGDVLFGHVAEADRRIVGHILFSRLPITLADRDVMDAAALGPLAVDPVRQRMGIGSALVWQGINVCRERGVPAVVVLGDPAFYTRFGFSVETARNLQTPWSGPNLMVIELVPGRLRDGRGAAHYARAFSEIDAT